MRERERGPPRALRTVPRDGKKGKSKTGAGMGWISLELQQESLEMRGQKGGDRRKFTASRGAPLERRPNMFRGEERVGEPSGKLRNETRPLAFESLRTQGIGGGGRSQNANIPNSDAPNLEKRTREKKKQGKGRQGLGGGGNRSAFVGHANHQSKRAVLLSTMIRLVLVLAQV